MTNRQDNTTSRQDDKTGTEDDMTNRQIDIELVLTPIPLHNPVATIGLSR